MTVLETARLRLRPLTAADTDALLAYRGDVEVCRYLPFPPMDAAEIARRLREQWFRVTLDEDGQNVTLGVERRDTGELIGDVILMFHSRAHGNGEIGWVFHPAAANQGYATEAASAMLDWGFGPVGLRRIVARLDERNDRSAALCSRLGMRLEARLVENEYFKGELSSELDFAILAHEWSTAVDGRPDAARG